MVELSEATRVTAAILVLSLVTVETGGMYLIGVARRSSSLTPFQQSFARAGHGHAGVLLVVSLLALLYADAAGLEGVVGVVARSGVPAAALLMSAGFFFSSMGRDVTAPNRLIAVVYVGAACLTAGLVALGVGLLGAGS